jgi:hypothetical protein
VYWQQFDPDGVPASGDEYTVVSWEKMKHWFVTPSTVNFQVKMFEATGDIEFHYGVMDLSDPSYRNGRSATVWVETEDGKYAVAPSILQPNVLPGMGFRYTRINP